MKHLRTRGVVSKGVSIVLSGVLAWSSLAAPATAFASPSSLEQELSVATARLAELSDELAQAEADLGKTNYELDQTKASINELQVQIDKNEIDLEEARRRLAVVIGDLYRQGGELGLLDLILRSDSFDQLLQRLYVANRISQQKREAIEEVSGIQDFLEESKASLETHKQEQETLLAAQKEQISSMKAAAVSQADYVGSLSVEVVRAIEAERLEETARSLKAAAVVLNENMAAMQAASATTAAANGAGAADAGAGAGAGGEAAVTTPDGAPTGDPAGAPAGDGAEGVVADAQAQDAQTAPAEDNGAAAAALVESIANAVNDVAEQTNTPSAPAVDTQESVSDDTGYSNPVIAPNVSYDDTSSSYEDSYDDSYTGSTSSSSGGYSSAAALAAVNAALEQVGKSYGHANDGNSWDCNGLTNYAWSQAGLEIPYASGHYAYGQYQYMQGSDNWVSNQDDLQAGDLVFYSHDGGDTTYHVAMYIGDGQIVHAVDYSSGVQVTDIDYVSGFVGGGSPY